MEECRNWKSISIFGGVWLLYANGNHAKDIGGQRSLRAPRAPLPREGPNVTVTAVLATFGARSRWHAEFFTRI